MGYNSGSIILCSTWCTFVDSVKRKIQVLLVVGVIHNAFNELQDASVHSAHNKELSHFVNDHQSRKAD